MIRIIMCEGKTDAILLSYVLESITSWKHTNKGPKQFIINVKSQSTEYAYWYKSDDEYLLICAVGGVNNFKFFFNSYIKEALVNTSTSETNYLINKIAIVTDSDDRKVNDIEAEFSDMFSDLNIVLNNNIWTHNQFSNGFNETIKLDFLLLVIPQGKEGALETVILDAISEDPYDKQIVEKSSCFVNEMKDIASKYIGKRRLELKAKLGVTWAIQTPDKSFDFLDEHIRSVHWNKYNVIKECFSELFKI